jgi:hypothetical protein
MLRNAAIARHVIWWPPHEAFHFTVNGQPVTQQEVLDTDVIVMAHLENAVPDRPEKITALGVGMDFTLPFDLRS